MKKYKPYKNRPIKVLVGHILNYAKHRLYFHENSGLSRIIRKYDLKRVFKEFDKIK